MKVIGLLIIFTILVSIDMPGMWRKKQWAEIAVYSILLAIGFTLGFLPAIGIELPNPNKPIESLIKKLSSGS